MHTTLPIMAGTRSRWAARRRTRHTVIPDSEDDGLDIPTSDDEGPSATGRPDPPRRHTSRRARSTIPDSDDDTISELDTHDTGSPITTALDTESEAEDVIFVGGRGAEWEDTTSECPA